MSTGESLLRCPGCGASLMLFVEATDLPGDGVLVCEHGHIYDLEDPADDSFLQAANGPAYRRHLSNSRRTESANHISV